MEAARKIVVIVEEVEVARTAFEWALHNLLRCGDLITLLHVFPTSRSSSRNKKKQRLLRLKGFQLALSFQDLCNSAFLNIILQGIGVVLQTRTEIVVREGDLEGGTIAATVREIGASTLVAGLHDQSFLYKLAMSHTNITNNLNCKILAIKQPHSSPLTARSRTISLPGSSTNMDFSQIEIGALSFPEIGPPKIQYQVCPDPHSIMWRSRRPRRRSKRI